MPVPGTRYQVRVRAVPLEGPIKHFFTSKTRKLYISTTGPPSREHLDSRYLVLVTGTWYHNSHGMIDSYQLPVINTCSKPNKLLTLVIVLPITAILM